MRYTCRLEWLVGPNISSHAHLVYTGLSVLWGSKALCRHPLACFKDLFAFLNFSMVFYLCLDDSSSSRGLRSVREFLIFLFFLNLICWMHRLIVLIFDELSIPLCYSRFFPRVCVRVCLWACSHLLRFSITRKHSLGIASWYLFPFACNPTSIIPSHTQKHSNTHIIIFLSV